MAVKTGHCCWALFFSVLPVSLHGSSLSLDGLAVGERKCNHPTHNPPPRLASRPMTWAQRWYTNEQQHKQSVTLMSIYSPFLVAWSADFMCYMCSDFERNEQIWDKKSKYHMNYQPLVCTVYVTGGSVGGSEISAQDFPWPWVKHRGCPRQLVFWEGGSGKLVVPGWTQKKDTQWGEEGSLK